MRITHREMVDEVRRELEMRRKVYPRWIREGRITEGEAEYRLRVMATIKAELEFIGQLPLFPTAPTAPTLGMESE